MGKRRRPPRQRGPGTGPCGPPSSQATGLRLLSGSPASPPGPPWPATSRYRLVHVGGSVRLLGLSNEHRRQGGSDYRESSSPFGSCGRSAEASAGLRAVRDAVLGPCSRWGHAGNRWRSLASPPPPAVPSAGPLPVRVCKDASRVGSGPPNNLIFTQPATSAVTLSADPVTNDVPGVGR